MALTQSTNVLYLGMATDIMGPILLVPEFDTIYVLNVLDRAFGGSWEDHKTRIRTILKDGSDENVEKHDFWYEHNHKTGYPSKEIHTLLGPSIITYDIDNQGYDINAKWQLEFIYNGKKRKLIYYYDFNFLYNLWADEITNINHILWNGTYCWYRIMEEDDDGAILLRIMMMERLAPEAYLYALSFNHKAFPEHILIYDGKERDGSLIAKMKLDFSDPKWWKKEYGTP